MFNVDKNIPLQIMIIDIIFNSENKTSDTADHLKTEK